MRLQEILGDSTLLCRRLDREAELLLLIKEAVTAITGKEQKAALQAAAFFQAQQVTRQYARVHEYFVEIAAEQGYDPRSISGSRSDARKILGLIQRGISCRELDHNRSMWSIQLQHMAYARFRSILIHAINTCPPLHV